MGQHDLGYRHFFSHRRMIQGLLREIVGERWVDLIDFDSGELVNPAQVFKDLATSRQSDVIWKFRRKDDGDPVYIYILMEFQSKPDPSMPVRLMAYEGLFYQYLLDGQPGSAWKKLPLIIPIVLYNGLERWNVATDLGSLIGDLDPSAEIYRPQLRYRLVDEAAYPREELEALNSPVADLFRIEKSGDWSEIRASVHRLRQNVAEAPLRKAFESWLHRVILPRFGLSQEESATLKLEELETMLAEKIDRWNREILEKGREEGLEMGLEKGRDEGRQEGRQEGEARMMLRLLRLKFGTLESEIEERVRSADPDRLLLWGDRVLTAETLQDIFQD